MLADYICAWPCTNFYGFRVDMMGESNDVLMADLAAAREQYLAGSLPSGLGRPVVLASWERCLGYGVNPKSLRLQTLDPVRLDAARQREQVFLERAVPVLQQVHESLGEQPHLLALSDRDGLVLRVLTSPGLSDPEALAQSNLFEGASWHESAIGCNGIGTCLAAGEPVILIGPEHLVESYIGWTCIGVPIRVAGKVVGALDFSVPNEHTHIHTWGWMLSLGKAIEASLASSSTAQPTQPAMHGEDNLGEAFDGVRGVFDLLARQLELSPTHAGFLEQARSSLLTAERQVQKAYVDARQAVKDRDRVLAVVSHDLRNPLHTITMASAVLLRDIPVEKKQTQAALIKRAAEQMQRLLQDLLDAARIEETGLSLNPEPCRAADLIQQAIDLLLPLADSRSVTLLGHPAPDAVVNADCARILQVFSNLISNAIEHTPKGGRVEVEAEVSERQELHFRVRDTGCGIAPEALPHIFASFWRGEESSRTGAGLGLSIAKEIVEVHEGRIWAQSEPGQGSTFHFTLPLMTTT